MASARVLVLRLDSIDPPGRLADWLQSAGVELVVAALDEGAELPPLAGFDGVVVLGGKMGANDDAEHPFLTEVKALLRDVVRDEVPTLAICLGAQLLAAANGGRVERNPEGPELGAQLVAKRTAASADPLFRSLPIVPDVIQWHYDTISTLPPGAIQLASSPVSENQAYRLGRLAWGVQFHIETTPEMVTAWAHGDADALTDVDLDAVLERAVAAHDDVAEAWAPFVAEFAAIVADPSTVTSAGTVPTSTAAPITDPAAIRAALAAELTASRSSGAQPLPMPGLRPHGE